MSGAQRNIAQSIRSTQSAIDSTQLRLASGKDVNSAIDNPANYFLSLSLSQKADDLSRLLDGIASNLKVVEEATSGAQAISKLLDTAEALLDEAREELYSGDLTSLVTELTPSDIAAILAANPGLSYSAASQSFYRVSAGTATWSAANAAALSATLVEPDGVIGVEGVTGHLANITSADENAFIQSMGAFNKWLGGSDSAVEGTWRWTSGPEEGEKFWQGTAGGSAPSGSYANWGAGEPNNSGNEDTVHMRADGFWNDQPGTSAYRYVIEWDASLFVTTTDEKLAARAREYSAQYATILEQIDFLAQDAHYRGINLLAGEDMRTNFNTTRSSFLITEGMDATSYGLNLSNTNFLQLSRLELSREQIEQARGQMRRYVAGLSTDYSIISVRLDFTKGDIDVHRAGASSLVDADKNELGAELLALQLRQQLQITSLNLASQVGITRLLS